MKKSIILWAILVPVTIALAALTYTTDEIQTLLDQVNNAVSTSSGSGDAGKMVELNASGKLDYTLGAGANTIKSENVAVSGADNISTLDFDAPFTVSESPDTEINIDLADDGVDSQHYVAGSIDPEHLNIANAETDEYFLTYEADTSNFQWVAAPGGGDITTVGLCETGDCTADFIDSTDIADEDMGDITFTDGVVTLDDDTVSTAEMADADHGDFTYSDGSATLDADVVSTAEMADADHGAFTYSGGTATLDANSVDSDQYVDGSIDLAHMSANSVDSDQYVDFSIDSIHIANGAIDGNKINDDVVDSQHYVAGSIDNEHMAANSIDSDQYVDGSIDLAHMSSNSIDSDQYVDGSIDPEHLNFVVAPGAGNDEYAVTYEHATGNFELVSLAAGGSLNAIFTETVQEGDSDIVSLDFDAPFSVTEAPDTYITIDIADDGLDSQHYAAGSIDAEHLAADVIDETKLADDSIDSEHYNDGSIDLAHLAADSVDGTKIADDAIDSEHYVDGSIDAAHLAADVIDETKIADDGIDSEHYNDGSIDPVHLNFVVAPGAGNDEYTVTYEHSTGNFELVSVAAGGSMNAVEEGDSQVGDSDIVTLDFDAGVFRVEELVDTEIDIDIQDDGIDSQHYIADSIDDEHINWGSGAGQVDYSDMTTGNISTSGTAATGALTVTGTISTSVGLDAVGAVDMDYGSADVTDHTFTTDGTGTAEFVIPNDSIDTNELLDDSILEVDLDAIDAAADGECLSYDSGTGGFEWVSCGGSPDKIEEGDSFVEVTDAGTGEVIIDVDDEDLEIKDGGANQINFTSNTGVDTIDFSMDIIADSFSTAATTSPHYTWADSDGGEGKLDFNGVNATDGRMIVKIDDSGGAEQTYMDFNGGTEEIAVSKVIDSSQGAEFQYIDAGRLGEFITTSNVDYSSSTVCEAMVTLGGAADADRTFQLPDDPLCLSGSYIGRRFCFTNTDPTYDLYISPNAADQIIFGATSCDTGDDILLDAGEGICLIGVTTGTWVTESAYGGIDASSCQ